MKLVLVIDAPKVNYRDPNWLRARRLLAELAQIAVKEFPTNIAMGTGEPMEVVRTTLRTVAIDN